MKKFHHIGTLVNDLKDAIVFYENLTQKKANDVVFVPEQGVAICVIGEIELIQPTDNYKLTKLLNKNIGFYHIAYTSDTFDKDLEGFESMGCEVVGKVFKTEVFQNRRCVFVKSPLGHLIELLDT